MRTFFSKTTGQSIRVENKSERSRCDTSTDAQSSCGRSDGQPAKKGDVPTRLAKHTLLLQWHRLANAQAVSKQHDRRDDFCKVMFCRVCGFRVRVEESHRTSRNFG